MLNTPHQIHQNHLYFNKVGNTISNFYCLTINIIYTLTNLQFCTYDFHLYTR